MQPSKSVDEDWGFRVETVDGTIFLLDVSADYEGWKAWRA
jgi:hypothetical protein